jgi:hypothetical protein
MKTLRITPEILAAMSPEDRAAAERLETFVDKAAALQPTFWQRWGTTLKGIGIGVVGVALGYGGATVAHNRKPDGQTSAS